MGYTVFLSGCVLLLWTPLRAPHAKNLSALVLILSLIGLGLACVYALRLLLKRLQHRKSLQWNRAVFIKAGLWLGFISWMLLSFLMAALHGMFPPRWVRSESHLEQTYDILDDSFLEPACRVTRHRYRFWQQDVTGLHPHCLAEELVLKTKGTQVQIWYSDQLLGQDSIP